MNAISDAGVQIRWRPTPWDARGLGVSTVELTAIEYADPAGLGPALAALDGALLAEGVGLATTRVPLADAALVAALIAAGYAHVETSHPLALDLAAWRPGRAAPAADATAADRDALIALATEGFDYSRFHEDPRVHPSRARARYASWIADSLDQHLAGAGDSVWVHHHRGLLAAVMSFRRRGERVQLYLGGTAAGLGLIAPMFWTGVLIRLRAEGVVHVDTRVSAANTGAVRLHAALGFATAGTDAGCTKIYDGSVGLPRTAART